MLYSLHIGLAAWKYLQYGNELDQAKRLWNLTVRFDGKKYFFDMRNCYTIHAKNPLGCFGKVNDLYSKSAALWNPTINLLGRVRLECSYKIHPHKLEHDENQLICAK